LTFLKYIILIHRVIQYVI